MNVSARFCRTLEVETLQIGLQQDENCLLFPANVWNSFLEEVAARPSEEHVMDHVPHVPLALLQRALELAARSPRWRHFNQLCLLVGQVLLHQ